MLLEPVMAGCASAPFAKRFEVKACCRPQGLQVQTLVLVIAAANLESIVTSIRHDYRAQREQHCTAIMAPECSAARNLGHLPNLHRHHHTMCMDNDTPERPPAWRQELDADLAQNWVVTAHDHRARSSCLERMVSRDSNPVS